MNRKEIGNRLRLIRESQNISRVQASEYAGIGTTTMQAWENGEREASIESIEKLAVLYKTSPQQIIFGKESYEQPEKTTDNREQDNEYIYIPAYDIEVSAGFGAFSVGTQQSSRHFAFRKRWAQARGLEPTKLSAVFARGDSMEPTIKDGAVVIIDHRRNRAMDGKIYVIRIDDRLWVKRVQWLFDGGLRLISDNQIYSASDISKKELQQENNIEVIGQVIHTSYDLE